MFRVLDTGTDRIFTVYAVREDKFLIFITGELPRWEWRDMSRFIPILGGCPAPENDF